MAANKVVISTPGPAGDAGVNFKGVWASDVQYFVRDVVRYAVDGNLYTCISTPDSVGVNPLNTNYFAVFVKISDARNWAITDQYSQVIDESGTAGYSSKHYAAQSEEWASKTDGAVRNDSNSADVDYSSKSWAIGGTGVTDTANAGAAKEWATTTGATVDGTEYSAKEYAFGTSVPAGSSKEWATTAGSAEVATGEGYSSKAYAQDDTNDIGSSKDWAVKAGSAQVASTDYSSKAYAQDTANNIGSSKDWAVKTSGQVASTDYSSKEWAVGTQTRGAASGGSAKDWATYTAGTVDDTDYSAKYWATSSNVVAVAGVADEIALLGTEPTVEDLGLLADANIIADMATLAAEAEAGTLAAKVNKSGDTMTGLLTLSGDPTADLHAAPKQYVDAKVSKSGDTMTGTLTLSSGDVSVATGDVTVTAGDVTVTAGDVNLSGDPTNNLHAAPKQYVDTTATNQSIIFSIALG